MLAVSFSCLPSLQIGGLEEQGTGTPCKHSHGFVPDMLAKWLRLMLYSTLGEQRVSKGEKDERRRSASDFR